MEDVISNKIHSETKKKVRNSSIELLKIIAMIKP